MGTLAVFALIEINKEIENLRSEELPFSEGRMCQECKDRWVASHSGSKGAVPVFPDCEDCQKTQVRGKM